jgi:hypothetical protein
MKGVPLDVSSGDVGCGPANSRQKRTSNDACFVGQEYIPQAQAQHQSGHVLDYSPGAAAQPVFLWFRAHGSRVCDPVRSSGARPLGAASFGSVYGFRLGL